LAFHGTFEHTLDSKNRLTMPAKFRAALADGVFLVRSEDPSCISVYPAATYETIATQALAGMNPLSREAREAKRLFYGRADDIELDGAGRVTLGSKHLEHAGIFSRDVVITGTGDSLELWSPDAWDTYDTDLTARAPELTASLGHPA
jgi:MraZ protein